MMSKQRSRFFILDVAVIGLLLMSCSQPNPTTSTDDGPSLAPGEHRVVYKFTGTSGREVKVQWVSTANQHQHETIKLPATREAVRSDGEHVLLYMEYKPQSGSIAVIRGAIVVDGAEWRSGSNAGNFLTVDLSGTIGER